MNSGIAATHWHVPLAFSLTFVALMLVVVVLALVLGFRPVDRLVDRWAGAHGLELDDDARALVTERIRLGRRIRTLGFVVGYSASMLRAVAIGNPILMFRALFPLWWWNLAGYFIGAVVAEIVFARASSPTGAAVIAPRALADYLPVRARLAPRLLAGAASALVVAYVVVPFRPHGTLGEQLATRTMVGSASNMWIAAAFVIGVVAFVEAVQRGVLRRRQQFASEALVRADDSLRAWSLRILTWVSVTIAASAVAFMLIPVGLKSGLVSFGHGSFAGAASAVGFGPIVIAFVAFRWLNRPLARWQVRRTQVAQAA